MKTLKKVPIEIVFTEFIPEVKDMEFGKLYYSEKYNTVNHLCPCGCGKQTPLPIKDGEWSISIANGKATLNPSIQHRFHCLSHYVISNGVANMLNDPMPEHLRDLQQGYDSQPGE